jgi:cation:H+ antiporter
MEIPLLIIGGLALLVVGGDLLVRGAVAVAEKFGISPLLIGLTLVGFGTSTPELVTSVQAAMAGSPGIAVGNIVGSNIANILLILGLSALIFPVAVGSTALKRDGGVVVATAGALVAVGMFAALSRIVGLLFLAALATYILYAFFQERVATTDQGAAQSKVIAAEAVRGHGRARSIALGLAMAIGGLVLVIFGGNWLVKGAIALARSYGVSETVIGLTIVAVGTSMPEFVTSVVAAIRRSSDVALGNILGSNIYNVLGIGGVTALISPTVIPPEIVRWDNLVMLAVSSVLLVFMATGLRIGRREGAALLAGYVAYVWSIWPA